MFLRMWRSEGDGGGSAGADNPITGDVVDPPDPAAVMEAHEAARVGPDMAGLAALALGIADREAGPAPVPVGESGPVQGAGSSEQATADALIAELRGLVPEIPAELIRGTTPADVVASLAQARTMMAAARAALQAEAAARVPMAQGTGGGQVGPQPTEPLDRIRAGIAAANTPGR